MGGYVIVSLTWRFDNMNNGVRRVSDAIVFRKESNVLTDWG